MTQATYAAERARNPKAPGNHKPTHRNVLRVR
jgi:hypothetical protein